MVAVMQHNYNSVHRARSLNSHCASQCPLKLGFYVAVSS